MSREPRKKPLGKALPRTDEDLDRRTSADAMEADVELMLAEATPEGRALMEADDGDGEV
jgi:hypothetical protein